MVQGGESGEREGSKEGQADCGGHWEAGKLPNVLEQWAELWMCSRSWIIYALVDRASARLFFSFVAQEDPMIPPTVLSISHVAMVESV